MRRKNEKSLANSHRRTSVQNSENMHAHKKKIICKFRSTYSCSLVDQEKNVYLNQICKYDTIWCQIMGKCPFKQLPSNGQKKNMSKYAKICKWLTTHSELALKLGVEIAHIELMALNINWNWFKTNQSDWIVRLKVNFNVAFIGTFWWSNGEANLLIAVIDFWFKQSCSTLHSSSLTNVKLDSTQRTK